MFIWVQLQLKTKIETLCKVFLCGKIYKVSFTFSPFGLRILLRVPRELLGLFFFFFRSWFFYLCILGILGQVILWVGLSHALDVLQYSYSLQSVMLFGDIKNVPRHFQMFIGRQHCFSWNHWFTFKLFQLSDLFRHVGDNRGMYFLDLRYWEKSFIFMFLLYL